MFEVVSVAYADRQKFIQFYKTHREKIKVHRSDLCYLLLNEKEAVAAVKFVRLQDDLWLLRNMLVGADRRNSGIGHRFLTELEVIMSDLNEDSSGLYCFPWSHLTDFYCAHGFSCFSDVDGNVIENRSHQPLHSAITSRYQTYLKRGLKISLCRRDAKILKLVDETVNN